MNVLKECTQLQHYSLIDKYFIRNGFLKIIIHNDDRPIKIKHPDNLFFCLMIIISMVSCMIPEFCYVLDMFFFHYFIHLAHVIAN